MFHFLPRENLKVQPLQKERRSRSSLQAPVNENCKIAPASGYPCFKRILRHLSFHVHNHCSERYGPRDLLKFMELENEEGPIPIENSEFEKLCLAIDGPCLFNSIQHEFKEHVQKSCMRKYDTCHLQHLHKWLGTTILPLIGEICYHNPVLSQLLSGEKRTKFEKDLELLMTRVFGESLSEELFSICFDYPDSQPILLDLRNCVKISSLRLLLVDRLKLDLERRLLHAGVTTVDVLEAYVSVVRSLKFLDPDGILLQLVTPPVREYLKQREETIRVILVSLTEESGELAEELAKNPADTDENANIDTAWASWIPDPIDIPRDKFNLRQADLIQTLVSIYGSKCLFIDEYRTLLADRLLKMPKPASIPRELKCLELLKLRFGDTDLQKCEVMLKDVSDSQRMNSRFKTEQSKFLETQEFAFSSLIVSAQFWPTFKQENLILPHPINEAIEAYTKTFEGAKGNRSLEWQKHIGTVEIELENFGATTTYNCSPAHAVIIWNFQEKPRWTLEELSEVTGMEVNALRSRMRFWLTRGVLVSTKADTYSLQEDEQSGGRAMKRSSRGGPKYAEDEEIDSPMTSTSNLRETELQMFWSYIEGMLTNLGTLPLTRIHSMLRLFATVECSSDELQKFLDEKVSQGLLVYSAGQYQLQRQ